MTEKRIKLDNKVCFKTDGTKETGAKIINELERLGGNNASRYSGNGTVHPFYWINYEGRITCDSFIPAGYTLTELPSEVKLSVGDAVRVKPNARWKTVREDSWAQRAPEFGNYWPERKIQHIFKIEGDLIYIDNEDFNGTNYLVVERENVELVKNKWAERLKSKKVKKMNIGDAVRINPNARWRTVENQYSSHQRKNNNFDANGWSNTPFGVWFETRKGIQYIFKIEGDLVYIDHKGYEGTNYIIVERENVYLVNSAEEKNQMKNRILTPANAQRIISVACSAWKSKLAEKWATNIVLNKDTEISEEFYQEMRSACTAEQNEIFDEIFGKDEQLIKASDLKIGEAMIVQDKTTSWNGIIISRIWSDDDEDEPRYVNMNDRRTTWSGQLSFKGKKVKLKITYDVLE
jgi:hypothetical protein